MSGETAFVSQVSETSPAARLGEKVR